MAETTTIVIQELRYATTETELHCFLGPCSAYRRFVPWFSKLEAPLHKKLRKEEPRKFQTVTEAKLQYVYALKSALTNPLILALPSANGQYTIDTNASDARVGCVLLQSQNGGTYCAIGFWKRTLCDLERKLATTHKEYLAVVVATLSLRPYLERGRFTVRNKMKPSNDS